MITVCHRVHKVHRQDRFDSTKQRQPCTCNFHQPPRRQAHLQLLVGEGLADGIDQRGARLLPQGRQCAQQQRQLRGGKAFQLRLRLLVGRLQGG